MPLPTGCREVTDQGVDYLDGVVVYQCADWTMTPDQVYRWDFAHPNIDPAALGTDWFVEPSSVVEHYLAIQSGGTDSEGNTIGTDVTAFVTLARGTQGPRFDSGSFSGGGGFGLSVVITGFFITARIGVPVTRQRIICDTGGGGTGTQTTENNNSGYRIEWDQRYKGLPQFRKLVLGARVGVTIPSLGMADRPHVLAGWKGSVQLASEGRGFVMTTTLILDKLPFTNPATGGSLFATINDATAGINSGAVLKEGV